ncbi:DUF1775 domain-containing protein [Rhodobacter sp.]
MIRNLLGAAVAATTLTALAVPAMAHVTLDTAEAAANTTVRLALRVPHGCGEEATHTLRVQIPAGFVNVQPMVKAGWSTEAVRGDYAAPVTHRDKEVTSGVTELVWSGGDLPSHFYDEFVLRGAVASSVEPGTQLFFAVVQECATGEAVWIDTSGNHDAEGPAPFITVIEAPAPSGH